MGGPRGTLLDRCLSKIDFTSSETGCWLWTAAKSAMGYGVIGRGPDTAGNEFAHRAVYMLAVGVIPDGLELDHLCRTPACVNPDHLEPVTHAENMRRGVPGLNQNAVKTQCKRGHPFDESNTYRRPDGRTRDCIACRRAASQRYEKTRVRSRAR